MNGRDRFLNALARQPSDRIPMTEICFWPETIQRWQKEGFPAGADPLDVFEMDRIHTSGLFDGSLRLPVKVIEETDAYKVEANTDGVVLKSWKQHYAPPVEVDFRIKTRQDWEAVKARFDDLDGRVGEKAWADYAAARDQGRPLIVTPVDPLWYVLRTLGFERCLTAMAEEPELVDDILETYTVFVLKMLKLAAARGFVYDALWFFSDLCYKNGMLFSPAMYRAWLSRYHRRFREYCTAQGMRLILHCDGDVRQFVPLLIEVGFDCVQPLEARAGNDVRVLKPQYGQAIAFFGNINMDVLARGDRSEIEREVATKVDAAKAGGGYIFHSDHSVPPTVSFASYKLACDTARAHGRF
jgi:uroporphyrinogen decarboxylase